MEDVAQVTPLITKKQTIKRQVERPAGRPQPTKYNKRAKAADVDTRAFVVHGIACQRPMTDTIQDVKKTGLRGIIRTRWLMGGQRRAGKTTSSVVIFSIGSSHFIYRKVRCRQRSEDAGPQYRI